MGRGGLENAHKVLNFWEFSAEFRKKELRNYVWFNRLSIMFINSINMVLLTEV